MSVVGLDVEAWKHLAVALTKHQRDMRRDGLFLPATVRDLLELAIDRASGAVRSRQEPSTRDVLAEMADAARVAVLLVTTDRAAEVLDVSESTVVRLCRSGELASVSVGRSRRIRTADLHAYVDSLGGMADAHAS